jgi:rRNA maturation RNase YbeY
MIFVANSHPTLRFSKKETFRTVRCVLKQESRKPVDLSVVFVGSRFIRQVNRRFLDHDSVTDVIAFPLGKDQRGVEEGEVYVNLDRARSQAAAYGVTFSEETKRLLIHGTLHLLGYSDSSPRGKNHMTEREDQILKRLSKTGR